MSKYPMLTHYVSEIDQFLQNFDKNHAVLSKSQQKEQVKYRRIYALRDDINNVEPSIKLWKNF
jgi:hypothetical protein